MCIYAHTHTHTHTHTSLLLMILVCRAGKYAYIYICIYIWVHTHTHALSLSHTHTLTHATTTLHSWAAHWKAPIRYLHSSLLAAGRPPLPPRPLYLHFLWGQGRVAQRFRTMWEGTWRLEARGTVWHDSFIHMWHDSFIHMWFDDVVWCLRGRDDLRLEGMCDMTHSWLFYSYGTWLIRSWRESVICNMTHSYATWFKSVKWRV